eukprot:7799703-Karenia_brevis.AAC.1
MENYQALPVLLAECLHSGINLFCRSESTMKKNLVALLICCVVCVADKLVSGFCMSQGSGGEMKRAWLSGRCSRNASVLEEALLDRVFTTDEHS